MAALTSTSSIFGPSNLLGIPEDHYGLSGINTGNLVHESIRLSKGLETKYDVNSRKIVVLNSSDLPLDELLEILNKNRYSYYGYKPVIDPKLDNVGNLQIDFKCITEMEEKQMQEQNKLRLSFEISKLDEGLVTILLNTMNKI